MKYTDEFVMFWGGEFSQWYESPFVEDGITFNTAEQYMMYHKAAVHGDYEIADQILKTNNPKTQKALGRKVRGYDDALWGSRRFDVVVQGNMLKFTQNPRLIKILQKTGKRELVEASPYDRIWGIGLGVADARAYDKSQWLGQNLLGQAIMKVRDELC
ncbi:hypothetical protein VPHD479_0141 [Vibrio phage D479]